MAASHPLPSRSSLPRLRRRPRRDRLPVPAFGFEEIYRLAMPDGRIGHAELLSGPICSPLRTLPGDPPQPTERSRLMTTDGSTEVPIACGDRPRRHDDRREDPLTGRHRDAEDPGLRTATRSGAREEYLCSRCTRGGRAGAALRRVIAALATEHVARDASAALPILRSCARICPNAECSVSRVVPYGGSDRVRPAASGTRIHSESRTVVGTVKSENHFVCTNDLRPVAISIALLASSGRCGAPSCSHAAARARRSGSRRRRSESRGRARTCGGNPASESYLLAEYDRAAARAHRAADPLAARAPRARRRRGSAAPRTSRASPS